MKHQIKSIFEEIAENVFKMNNLLEAKTFIIEFVTKKGINDVDKKNILLAVDECKNIFKLHYYISNALLRYEGLSVNKAFENKGKKPVAELIES